MRSEDNPGGSSRKSTKSSDESGVGGGAHIPEYGQPKVERYTKKGYEEDQERIKVVRPKTVLAGTLTGKGPVERTTTETLADFRAGKEYQIMMALADHMDCEVTPK